jgi:hypothetical protein
MGRGASTATGVIFTVFGFTVAELAAAPGFVCAPFFDRAPCPAYAIIAPHAIATNARTISAILFLMFIPDALLLV